MSCAVFQHICPLNCFSSCGLQSTVHKGRVVTLTGDKNHPYTRGVLCHIGSQFLKTCYAPNRVLFPMKQQPRGSGRWQKLSWDQALHEITEKMLFFRETYRSFLPLCFFNNSGNIGLLHQGPWNWFAQSLQTATLATGSVCWGAGLDAVHVGAGDFPPPDPAAMRHANLIVLWGANPVYTAIHQMIYIQQAQSRGAKVVVIDPVITPTASQADVYLQIRPGQDGALALAVIKILFDRQWLNPSVVESLHGWSSFASYLASLDLARLLAKTGLPFAAAEQLAEDYCQLQPGAAWVGLGLQRHGNGGQNTRIIQSLSALTGQLQAGGFYFANPYNNRWFVPPFDWLKDTGQTRTIPAHSLASGIAAARPPVKMLFLANANPLAQLSCAAEMAKSMKTMDCIVYSGFFLNQTAELADYFLPATTYLEHYDIQTSYWHSYAGVNQAAIPPLGECRSDVQIAASLAACLNRKSPGSSLFPAQLNETDWLDLLLPPATRRLLGIRHWQDLIRLRLLPVQSDTAGRFPTPSGRYELYSTTAAAYGLPRLPVYMPPPSPSFPYRLLTNHSRHGLNSQFFNLPDTPAPHLYLHPRLAQRKKFKEGQTVLIFNDHGQIRLPVHLTPTLPEDTLLVYQQPLHQQYLNSLMPESPTDMGAITGTYAGLAYYDLFVDIAAIPLFEEVL